jgi:CxxC-x17-CxxC domain-containing protein
VRPETRTTCSDCGAETTVPFKPTQGRPVLCRSCFQKQQANPSAEPAPSPAPIVAQD